MVESNENKLKESKISNKSYDQLGNKIINNYKILDILGVGSYAKVKLVEDIKTSNRYCFKIINENVLERKKKSFNRDEEGNVVITTMLDDSRNEEKILKLVNHKNISKLYEIIKDSENRKNYLVMGVAEKGPLMTYDDNADKFIINKYLAGNKDYIEEKYIRGILHGVAEAINYLHSNNIVHRDIKPDNILINSDFTPILTDFSIASQITGDDIFTKTEGNNYFYSPELCQGIKTFATKPVDIWAYGVCAYIMIYNKLPIMPKNKLNMIELFSLIKKGDIKYPKPNHEVSEELLNLVKRCLEANPKKRITASELINESYFKEG